MPGSASEERIRAKVEAALRAEFPDARIVHELNTEWGGIRLDLAAVRPDAITLVEIKSERDVLTRLESQVKAALRVTGDVRVYAAEKHRAALDDAGHENLRGPDGRDIYDWTETKGGGRAGRGRPNPGYIRDLRRSRVYIETDAGFSDIAPMHVSWWARGIMEHMADPRSQLEMLWHAEMVAALNGAGIAAGKRPNRTTMKRLALEHMTGQQIRRSVCTALRGRPFARADQSEAA